MANLFLAPTDDGLQRHTHNCVGVKGLFLSQHVIFAFFYVSLGVGGMMDGREAPANQDLWLLCPNVMFMPVGLLLTIGKDGFFEILHFTGLRDVIGLSVRFGKTDMRGH